MKKTLIFGVLSCIYMGTSAQEHTPPDSTKQFSLDEVVISVNKEEETVKTVSQQVQVLTEKDIANSQAQSTADLVQSAGVFVQKSQQGGGSPVLRGFEASRVLLVIDGVRMNNLIYRSGHLQSLITADNNSLERLEVLFGPASTIYGSDALGGVVHLYTKRPRLTSDEQRSNIKLNLFSRYGAVNGEITNHFDFNFGKRKFGSLTSFTYSKFGDLMGGKNQNPFYTSSYGERPYYAVRINGRDTVIQNTNRFLQVQSGYSQYDLTQKFLYKPKEYLSHMLNFQFSNSTDVPRYDRLTDPGGPYGLRNAEWYYGPQMRFLAAYDMAWKKPEGVLEGIHFGINYQALEESRHNRNFGSRYLNHRTEQVGILGANLDLQKKIRSHDMRFGFDMQMNSLKSTASKEDIEADTSGVLDTRYPDGDNTMNNFALYFSHTWKINEHTVLTDGLRGGFSSLHSTLVDTATLFHLPYTEIEQKTPVYSGSLGLIHSPSDDLKMSLTFSTGFRVPNVDDMSKVFESVQGTVICPNPDLGPEKTMNYELGLTKIFSKKTKLETYVYYTRFADAIVMDTGMFNGKDSILYDGVLSRVYTNQNKGEAYLYGFSTNLRSHLTDNLTMMFVLNYTYGRVKTDSVDTPLDHVSPVMARLQFVYTYKKFSADFFINYNGWKRIADYSPSGEDNQQYATPQGMPAWFTVNLRGSRKMHKYVTVMAGVDNIFDTQYRVFASGINAPGRNVFITLRGHF